MALRSFGNFLISGIVITIFVFVTFATLQWLEIPAGNFIDWLVGIVSFWWLLFIVSLPWNIHFRAKEVILDAEKSEEKGIVVKQDRLNFAKTWVKRSLVIAISLHIISAVGLYLLAATGVSPIGYISAAAALVLTGLRPMVRAYEYLVERLGVIQHEFRFPREDVVTIRQNLESLIQRVETLESELNTDNSLSWAAQQQANVAGLNQALNQVKVDLSKLHTTNQAEHATLSRNAENAIAQITADGQFLGHVREIIRFVKEA
ncbi:MAG: hypothetical protein AAF485_17250 [Chloroflexota bacterium]